MEKDVSSRRAPDDGRGTADWLLVIRYVVPAMLVPFATLLAFGVVVAITGTGRVDNIETTAYTIAGSSFVLVFTHLAARDRKNARQNVMALAALCFIIVAIGWAASGGWREPADWIALLIFGLWLSAAALVGVRWARRWAKWRDRRAIPKDNQLET
jgi:dolichol kinase